jgi:hypothetical protein
LKIEEGAYEGEDGAKGKEGAAEFAERVDHFGLIVFVVRHRRNSAREERAEAAESESVLTATSDDTNVPVHFPCRQRDPGIVLRLTIFAPVIKWRHVHSRCQ